MCVCVTFLLFHALDTADINYLTGCDREELRKSSAIFLLKLKEQRRTSQVVINDIVENCKGLFSQTIEHVHAGVRAKLADSGMDPESVSGLCNLFKDVVDPFDGLETCYLQEKYFHEKLGLIVS